MKPLHRAPMLFCSALIAAPAWALPLGHPAHPDTAVPIFRPADFFPAPPQFPATADHEHGSAPRADGEARAVAWPAPADRAGSAAQHDPSAQAADREPGRSGHGTHSHP